MYHTFLYKAMVKNGRSVLFDNNLNPQSTFSSTLVESIKRPGHGALKVCMTMNVVYVII
jgi:hypothetical protein